MPWQPVPRSAIALAGPTPRSVEVGGRRLIVTEAGGSVYAFEDRCSHAGCAFSEDGDLDGTRIICDCHGSEFDVRTGQVRRPPAREPIATFAVRVVGDGWEVDV